MISAKCITHGRVHLLEEALNSFLLQDDPEDTELVIVNDYSHQRLIFDHPRVKIYNLYRRKGELCIRPLFWRYFCSVG